MRYCTGLLGVPIDTLSMAEVLSLLLDLVKRGKEDHVPRLVATVNVDFLVHIYNCWTGGLRSLELLQVLRRADVVLADGMPLIWLSRCLGGSLRQRIAGATLVPLLAERAAQAGLSLFLLGGESSVAHRAADNLLQRYPGLNIAGIATPLVSLHPDEPTDLALLEELERAQPDILLIGLGSPKQELWFDRVRTHLHVPLSIGVGGTFKFLAGTVSRAPIGMQNLGLEWLYRWIQEPGQLTKRYLRGLIEFPLLGMPALFWSLFAEKASTHPNGFVAQVDNYGEPFPVLHLPSALGKQTYTHVMNLVEAIPNREKMILDFFATKSLDPIGAGLLLELYRTNQGVPLKSEPMTVHMEKLLKLHRVRNCVQVEKIW